MGGAGLAAPALIWSLICLMISLAMLCVFLALDEDQ
jgi:hypothetical protein